VRSALLSRTAGGIVILAVLLIATPSRIFADGLSADDASYVAHAFTLAFDGDLDYSNESFDWVVEGPNGSRPAHPIGPGLAAAPVVALFAVIDRLEGNAIVSDRTQVSTSRAILGFYVASVIALGGAIYALVMAIRMVMDRPEARKTIIIAIMGSGIPFYALNRFTMSHSFEFLFLSLMILAGVRLVRTQQNRAATWLLLGLSSSMTLLIRPGNLPFLLLPLWAAISVRIASGSPWVRSDRRDALLGAGAMTVFWLPSALLQHHLYGTPVTLSYATVQGSNWSGPDGLAETLVAAWERLDLSRLILLFVGAEFGVLWSSFVIVIGIWAVAVLARRARNVSATFRVTFVTLGTLMLSASIVSVFGAGQMGIDYGNRFLYPLVPPTAFSLGLLLTAAATTQRRKVEVLVLTMSLIGVLSAAFYQSAGSNDRLLTHSSQENIFGQEVTSSRNFGRELVAEIHRPQAWARVVAIRAPGFFLVRTIDERQILELGNSLGVSEDRLLDGIRWHRQSDWFDVMVVAGTLTGLVIALLRMFRARPSLVDGKSPKSRCQ